MGPARGFPWGNSGKVNCQGNRNGGCPYAVGVQLLCAGGDRENTARAPWCTLRHLFRCGAQRCRRIESPCMGCQRTGKGYGWDEFRSVCRGGLFRFALSGACHAELGEGFKACFYWLGLDSAVVCFWKQVEVLPLSRGPGEGGGASSSCFQGNPGFSVARQCI